MIRLIEHKDIDKRKWDACISGSAAANFYAESEVLDFFSEGWDALVEDDYHSVMPLTKHKKYGVHYLRHPIVLQQLGVFGKSESNPSVVNSFMKSLPDTYRYVDIFLNKSNQPDSSEFQIKPNINFELNLDKNISALQKSYSVNHKRSLKKFSGSHMKIESCTPEQVIAIFKITKGKQISSYSTKDYKRMLDFMNLFAKRDRCICFSASSADGRLHAASAWFLSSKKITYLKGSSDETGRKTGAMHALMNHVIEKYGHSKMILDFGGSNIASLAHFYESFGATATTYLHVKRNRLPWPIKLIRK